jgi:hypothetical protein
MRLVKSLITGSVALGILVAAGASVAAVNFSSSLASDHSIVAQPAASQSGDTRNGTDDVIADDRTSPAPRSEPESGDDNRNGTAAGDDAVTDSNDDSTKGAVTVAAPRTSDDGGHQGDATTRAADDHGSDNRR